MNCPKCGSEKITFNTVQAESKESEKGRGCLWSIGRIFLIVFTMGLWLLVGKSKGSHKTTFSTKTMATCQNCGNAWQVK